MKFIAVLVYAILDGRGCLNTVGGLGRRGLSRADGCFPAGDRHTDPVADDESLAVCTDAWIPRVEVIERELVVVSDGGTGGG